MINISLIGMSGSGKSTIGKILSEKLNYKHFDTDSLIAEYESMDIDSIFKTKGEGHFRNIEASILKEALRGTNRIISTGGGAILDYLNRIELSKKSFIIYLYSDLDQLYENIKKSSEKRPLLENDQDIKLNISNMYSKREKIYKELADQLIDVRYKSVYDISDEIIDIYNKKFLR